MFYSYVDSAHALEKEGGTSLAKYEVCDNIDLPTILQVYSNELYNLHVNVHLP